MLHGKDGVADKIFETIMLTGSKYDKDHKFRLYKWKLGLRENYIEK